MHDWFQIVPNFLQVGITFLIIKDCTEKIPYIEFRPQYFGKIDAGVGYLKKNLIKFYNFAILLHSSYKKEMSSYLPQEKVTKSSLSGSTN